MRLAEWLDSSQLTYNLNNLTQHLHQAETATIKEQLQMLYRLKPAHPPSISVIAKALGKHRRTILKIGVGCRCD